MAGREARKGRGSQLLTRVTSDKARCTDKEQRETRVCREQRREMRQQSPFKRGNGVRPGGRAAAVPAGSRSSE